MDHIASDLSAELRKLKHAYETLNSKKDNEVSALLSEKDSVSNKLSIMHQDYANKKVEAAQATEAALKLQQSVDELKVLAQKKDDEIGRLQAEVVGAKRDLQKMYPLVKEKDDKIQRLESVQKLIKDYVSETKTVEKDGRDETTQKHRSASSMSNDDEKSGSGEDDDGQIGSDEDGDKQSGSHKDGEGSSNDEDGDEESSSDEDSDEESTSDEDEHKPSGNDEETMNNPVEKHPGNPKRKRSASSAQIANGKNQNKRNGVTKTSKHPPKPLRRRRLVTVLGKKCMVSTGNWAQFVSDVKDSLADQPGKLKEFVQLLCNPHSCTIRVGVLTRTMAVLLDGHPTLIDRFNLFLPKNCKITLEIMEEEHPDEQPCQRGVPQPCRRLPSASASESASASAVLIKPKEEEQ